MKIVVCTVCTVCDRRPHECICQRSDADWQEVTLETPAEVRARLHRLLNEVERRSPSSRAVCKVIRPEAMEFTAAPEKTGRRPTARKRNAAGRVSRGEVVG